jgi:hypothetical protein
MAQVSKRPASYSGRIGGKGKEEDMKIELYKEIENALIEFRVRNNLKQSAPSLNNDIQVHDSTGKKVK